MGDLSAPTAFRGRGTAKPGLSLTVMLDGAGRGWLTGQDGAMLHEPVAYGPGLVFLYFVRKPTQGFYEVPAGSRFRTIKLRLDPSFLERSGLIASFADADGTHPLGRIHDDTIWIGRAGVSTTIVYAAQSLLDAATSIAGDSRLEVRALDILAEAEALMSRPVCPLARAGRTRASDRAELEAARDLMLADLTHAWSFSSLATWVGVSATKLKIGFRECFGLPVYAFLQRACRKP